MQRYEGVVLLFYVPYTVWFVPLCRLGGFGKDWLLQESNQCKSTKKKHIKIMCVWKITWTYIDEILTITNEQVSEDAGFVEVPQANHIFHPMGWGGMHRLDTTIWCQPVLVTIIVTDVHSTSFCLVHFGTNCHVKFSIAHGFNPDVVTLQQRKN